MRSKKTAKSKKIVRRKKVKRVRKAKKSVRKNKIKRKTETVKVKKRPRKEIEKYKKLLLEQKQKLLIEFLHIKQETLNKTQKEASGDLSGYSYHIADMASDVYETDFMLRLASDERNKINEIEDALKRIEDNEYGMCLVCSKPISQQRLSAVPQASYCLKCKQEQEKQPRKEE